MNKTNIQRWKDCFEVEKDQVKTAGCHSDLINPQLWSPMHLGVGASNSAIQPQCS